jgi:hypothetical protein
MFHPDRKIFPVILIQMIPRPKGCLYRAKLKREVTANRITKASIDSSESSYIEA